MALPFASEESGTFVIAMSPTMSKALKILMESPAGKVCLKVFFSLFLKIHPSLTGSTLETFKSKILFLCTKR